MSPSRLQSHATTAGRWTDEEHEILVDLTNHQLELEKQDESKVISWAKHWDNVAAQLKKSGYIRTSAACLGYWKRTVGAQKANEKAAGPRWDDGEHQILVGMTEEQLEAEAGDPAAVMSWQRHWKKVSERLKEEGYSRSVDACDAYWNLVQDNSPLAAVGLDDEDESSEEPLEVEPLEEMGEEKLESEEAPESEKEPEPEPEIESKPESVKEVEPEPEPEEVPKPSNDPTPLPEESKKREEPPSKIESESPTVPTAPLRSPSPQVGWSSVNRGRRPKTPRKPLPGPYYPDEEEKAPVSIEDPLPFRDILPESAPYASPGRPPKKHKTTAFRFQPEQRNYLEEEVQRNGSNPDQNRRLEIASELGVEEKTVRNWFVHHRQRASRKSLETRPREDFAYANEFSLPNLAAKRGRNSVDGVEMSGGEEHAEAIEVIPRHQGPPPSSNRPNYPPHKRPRIESELTPDPVAQARMSTPTQGHSMHPYGKPQRILQSNYAEESSASRGSPVDSPLNDLEPINIIRKIPPPAAVLPSNNFEDQAPVRQVPGAGMGGRPRRPSPPPPSNLPPPHLVMKPQPSSNPPRTAPQALHDRGIPVDAKFIMESGDPSRQQGGINFKPYHHPTNKNPADYESPWKGTPIKFDERPPTSRSSQSSSFRDSTQPTQAHHRRESTEASSVTPGPGLGGSASTPTPRSGETDKGYATRKIAEIQGHIHTLKQDTDSHVTIINRLEAQIDQVKRQENALYQQKENEIQQFLREIEHKYQREVAVLSENHKTLFGKRETELDFLRKNQRQVEKSEKKMRSYQTIVDVDDDSS